MQKGGVHKKVRWKIPKQWSGKDKSEELDSWAHWWEPSKLDGLLRTSMFDASSFFLFLLAASFFFSFLQLPFFFSFLAASFFLFLATSFFLLFSGSFLKSSTTYSSLSFRPLSLFWVNPVYKKPTHLWQMFLLLVWGQTSFLYTCLCSCP